MSEAVLDAGRFAAERRMTSRCDIGRQSGTTTVDRLKVPAWTLVHTGTPFKLGQSGQAGSAGGAASVTIGDVVYETATAVGHLIFDLADMVDEDVIRITAGEWPDTFWRVVKATMKNDAVDRRVPIAQTSRPAGWPS